MVSIETPFRSVTRPRQTERLPKRWLHFLWECKATVLQGLFEHGNAGGRSAVARVECRGHRRRGVGVKVGVPQHGQLLAIGDVRWRLGGSSDRQYKRSAHGQKSKRSFHLGVLS